MNTRTSTLLLCAIGAVLIAAPLTAARKGGPAPAGEAKLFRFSTTIEKERPELDDETKALIAAYRQAPTPANKAALRRRIAQNYDAIIRRKEAKLEELKHTAKHASKVQEMQEIVDEMYQNRESRIEQNLCRFTDPRLRPGSREAEEGFLPLIGAEKNVDIAYTPVTNADYAKFLTASGHAAPKGWSNRKAPAGKGDHPVTGVSCNDAAAYCAWLTKRDGKATYRLPTEREWEFAAGHMPKDADFNCGAGTAGTTPVKRYAQTLSACGAIDMWGNCWEWTATVQQGRRVVKGGAYDSARTDCRTERKGELRAPAQGYANVTFRVVRVK